jgi:hypothetical protein
VILLLSVVFGVVLYLAVHLSAGHAHYRHQKAGCAAAGHRAPSLWASLGRGPYVYLSTPIGGGFRLGHGMRL